MSPVFNLWFLKYRALIGISRDDAPVVANPTELRPKLANDKADPIPTDVVPSPTVSVGTK